MDVSVEFGSLQDRANFVRAVPDELSPKLKALPHPSSHVVARKLTKEEAGWFNENTPTFGGHLRVLPTVTLAIEFEGISQRQRYEGGLPGKLRADVVNFGEQSPFVIAAGVSPTEVQKFEETARKSYGNVRKLGSNSVYAAH